MPESPDGGEERGGGGGAYEQSGDQDSAPIKRWPPDSWADSPCCLPAALSGLGLLCTIVGGGAWFGLSMSTVGPAGPGFADKYKYLFFLGVALNAAAFFTYFIKAGWGRRR